MGPKVLLQVNQHGTDSRAWAQGEEALLALLVGCLRRHQPLHDLRDVRSLGLGFRVSQLHSLDVIPWVSKFLRPDHFRNGQYYAPDASARYAHGPDPHDYFGCSVPFAMWLGCLLVATLSCYTTDYIRYSFQLTARTTPHSIHHVLEEAA